MRLVIYIIEKELVNLGLGKEHIRWLKETNLIAKPENEHC